MSQKVYEYESLIYEAAGKGGAYVIFPYDIRTEFGRGRVKVHATFDGEPYDGSIVNMGVKNEDGSICYIIGIRKDIRTKIGKQLGDQVKVTIREREQDLSNTVEKSGARRDRVPPICVRKHKKESDVSYGIILHQTFYFIQKRHIDKAYHAPFFRRMFFSAKDKQSQKFTGYSHKTKFIITRIHYTDNDVICQIIIRNSFSRKH